MRGKSDSQNTPRKYRQTDYAVSPIGWASNIRPNRHRSICQTIYRLSRSQWQPRIADARETVSIAMSKSSAAIKNFYEILNSQQRDAIESIKREYQLLVLRHHPDKNRGDDDTHPASGDARGHPAFQQIDEAWKTLRDPVARRAYDAELNQHKFNEKRIVHDTLTIDQFAVDDENAVYLHLCRCGGYFVIPRDECIDGAMPADEEILINCDECSLVVKLAR